MIFSVLKYYIKVMFKFEMEEQYSMFCNWRGYNDDIGLLPSVR